jgi:hypothetical protein
LDVENDRICVWHWSIGGCINSDSSGWHYTFSETVSMHGLGWCLWRDVINVLFLCELN